MITYHRLWDIMEKQGFTTYMLIHDYGISANQINRWKHGADMKLSTLNSLCSILKCTPSDILDYSPDLLSPVQLQDRKVYLVSDHHADSMPFSDRKPATRKPRSHGFLADRLSQLIKDRELTPHRLAMLSGVPLSTIRNILYGKTKNSRIETLTALANALQVSVEELTRPSEED